MNLDERVEFFKASTLLATLDGTQVTSLAEACRETQPKAGHIIARNGEIGDFIHWVVDGEFEVFVEQPELGLEREIRRLVRGDHFGEISLLTGTPRTASVRASTPGHLLELDKATFLECLLKEQGLLAAFLQRLGRYLADAALDQASVSLVRLGAYPAWPQYRHALPGKIAESCRAVVLAETAGEVTVGMPDPYDQAARNFLVQVLHPRHPRFVALTPDDYDRAVHEDQAPPSRTGDEVRQTIVAHGLDTAAEELREDGADAELRWIFGLAHDGGATDVHLDPIENAMLVRLRIQGNMVTLDRSVPRVESPRVASRLKIIAGLDITERRRPQDGSFLLSINGQRRCVRISIVPSYWGEKVALRFLADEADGMLLIETLVPCRPVSAAIRELFAHPSGLVLVCGPTGSGKTTLLYSGLRSILDNNPIRNIVAIEEPVDRLLKGVTQIPVNRRIDFGFAEALRAVLRQDPDVVLLGEIRDRETARVAVEAAATGHLVVSSVHASFAPDALTRLRSLEVEPYLIEASLKGVIALRLVPRNCPECSELVGEHDTALHELRRAAAPIFDRLVPDGIRRGRGCPTCRNRGTIGRMALVEILPAGRGMYIPEESGDAMRPSSGWLPMYVYARFIIGQGWVAPEHLLAIFGPASAKISAGIAI